MNYSNSEDTRERLLGHARRLFAERGYRGASVRAITTAAEANLGAITYHFGTKQALYEAVLEHCLAPMRTAIVEVAGRSDEPMDRIEAILRAFFAHLRANPDVPQFLLQEVASGNRPSAPVQHTLEQGLGSLASVIREGQEDGSLWSGDPRLTAVSIVAQPVHLTLLGRLLQGQTAAEEILPGAPDAIEEHALAFVRTALQSSPVEVGKR